MRVRIHTTDTVTGEAELHDIEIAELSAQAIADALREGPWEELAGVCLHMAPASDGSPTSGAFILRGNMGGEYHVAGTIYTQFAS